MSERPGVLFGAFLLLTAAAAAALVAAFLDVGGHGVAGMAAVAAGLLSACILFALELRHLPPALVLVSATGVATCVALVRSLRAVWREQRLLRSLPSMELAESSYGESLACPTDVPVHVLRSSRPGAFCAGVLRPRVVITTALLDSLDDDERSAVLAHELSHARGMGPLKVALGRLAARALFWVPALGDLVDRFTLLSELAADRAAVAETSRAALAGALSEVLAAPRFAGGVGLADHAGARIDRLFDPQAPLPPLFERRRLALTLLVGALAAAVAYWSPRLAGGESAHLHAMTISLLAHHLRARLVGLAATAAGAGIVAVGVRRLANRAR